jgi:hypothetical protein
MTKKLPKPHKLTEEDYKLITEEAIDLSKALEISMRDMENLTSKDLKIVLK